MRKLMSLFIWCWLVTAAHAQVVAPPSIELRDEGSVLGRVRVLDCTGTGISCTRNGSVGTIDGSGGGSGAPVDAEYWLGAVHGSLANAKNLGALSTGLVLNTAGTPTTYGGATCTNQVIRLLSTSGAATCVTLTATYVDTTIWTGTATSGILKATSQGILAAATAGVDYAAASHAHVDADIPNTITVDLAAAATALAADPADCGLNTYATSINASGTLGCAQPSFSELSGSAIDSQIPNNITIDLATTATTASALAANGGNCVGNNFAVGVDASGVAECAQPAFLNLSGSLALSQGSMATARLLGRTTAGTGAFEEITVNSPLTFSAGALDIASIADADLASNYSGIGDCGAGNFARTLNDNASPTCAADDDTPDSLSELPTISTARILGRVTASTGVVEELTGTQATTLLDAFTSGLKGLAPASGGGTTNFLRADGTWNAPPGGGGAPTDATYWTGAAHASLSAELNLGALGTGLVINTTGTPSIYAGTSCTNQFPRSLSTSGAATCANVAASDFGSQTANFVLVAPNGSAGGPTFRALVDGDIPDSISLTNLTQIGTRAISDTTGTLGVGRGGSGLTTVAANQIYVGTAVDTMTAKTLPSCSNGTADKLLYNNSTNEFSCGTDQGGAGGGLSHDQTMTRISYGF